MPVPDGLEDGEDLLPGAAHQEQVLGLVEGDDPGVPLHRRGALLVLQGHALLTQQVKAFHLHLETKAIDNHLICHNLILMTQKNNCCENGK